MVKKVGIGFKSLRLSEKRNSSRNTVGTNKDRQDGIKSDVFVSRAPKLEK